MQGVTELKRKISLNEFLTGGEDEVKWASSRKAAELLEELRAQQADEKICLRQADRLKREGNKADKGRSLRRSFVKLFTTSKLGLGITSTSAGKRSSSAQGEFRTNMIDVYNSKDPDPRKRFLWCPIVKDWFDARFTSASHLFAYMHGQDTMDAIFGPTDTPELFSPLNGLILSTAVEDIFDKGFLTIVPRLPDLPSREQVALWNASKPKEYKIFIIDHNYSEMDLMIRPGSDQTWRDLDGTNVEFRSDFRPRARYAFFHYCVQILRKAWREQRTGETLKREFDKWYWGTPGRFLPKNMLLGLVEELGHEWENLMNKVMEDEEDKKGARKENAADGNNEILLAVISDQVKATAKGQNDEDDEDDTSDEEENEAENPKSSEETGSTKNDELGMSR